MQPFYIIIILHYGKWINFFLTGTAFPEVDLQAMNILITDFEFN
jgi:hypothetical protein